jgi:replication factor C small subunit
MSLDVELPWTEKYRPKKLADVVGHEEIVKRLKAYVKEKNLPNLILSGPAGIGKTVCAMAMANGLYEDSVRQNVLELNASDERGIDIIRGKIKDFAATMAFGEAKFKIVFLDEADALTRDAQNALRRTMEKYAATARFILTCNYSSRIIGPIQSRCSLFRFSPLNETQLAGRLKTIVDDEKLDVTDEGYKALVYASEGDMRKAINFLQTASSLRGKITDDTVYKVSARARPKEIKELVELSLGTDFEAARKKLDALLYEYGMSGEDVMLQIYREIVALDMDQKKKVQLIDKIGEYNFRLTEGANERIQLEALLAYMTLVGK